MTYTGGPSVIDFRAIPNSPTFLKPYGPPEPWPADRPATWLPLAYGRAALTPVLLGPDSTTVIAPHGQTMRAERTVMGTFGGNPALDDYFIDRMGFGARGGLGSLGIFDPTAGGGLDTGSTLQSPGWTEQDDLNLAAAVRDRKGDLVARYRAKRNAHFSEASRDWFSLLPTIAQMAIVLMGGLALIRVIGLGKG